MKKLKISAGSPIKSFIEQVKKETIDGLGDWELREPIDLELSAIIKGKAGGEMDIQIVNFGAKIEAEQTHRIKMSIGPKDEAIEAEKKDRIARAKAREEFAKKHPSHSTVQK